MYTCTFSTFQQYKAWGEIRGYWQWKQGEGEEREEMEKPTCSLRNFHFKFETDQLPPLVGVPLPITSIIYRKSFNYSAKNSSAGAFNGAKNKFQPVSGA